jgi:hypothetical protein
MEIVWRLMVEVQGKVQKRQVLGRVGVHAGTLTGGVRPWVGGWTDRAGGWVASAALSVDGGADGGA